MKRIFAFLLVAATVVACSSSYSRLEVRDKGTDRYVRFDGGRNLEIGVGWSARFRALDTSDDPHSFELKSADDSKLVVAPVAKDPDDLDAKERLEEGTVFAFLPRKLGTTEVDVVVDGAVVERISLMVGAQR
jgi:hypothetical protein